MSHVDGMSLSRKERTAPAAFTEWVWRPEAVQSGARIHGVASSMLAGGGVMHYVQRVL